jgi:GxxExxY protein
MNFNDRKIPDKKLTYAVIGVAMDVYNALGYGFLEKVYENAIKVGFTEKNINAEFQKPIKIHYHNEIVGDYIADILVNDELIIELKAVENLTDIHRAQVINYLKATKLRLALLINFGKEKLEYERIIN